MTYIKKTKHSYFLSFLSSIPATLCSSATTAPAWGSSPSRSWVRMRRRMSMTHRWARDWILPSSTVLLFKVTDKEQILTDDHFYQVQRRRLFSQLENVFISGMLWNPGSVLPLLLAAANNIKTFSLQNSGNRWGGISLSCYEVNAANFFLH